MIIETITYKNEYKNGQLIHSYNKTSKYELNIEYDFNNNNIINIKNNKWFNIIKNDNKGNWINII